MAVESLYLVECKGEARELYWVVAKSAEEAMKNWSRGKLDVSEASSMEPVKATPYEGE